MLNYCFKIVSLNVFSHICHQSDVTRLQQCSKHRVAEVFSNILAKREHKAARLYAHVHNTHSHRMHTHTSHKHTHTQTPSVYRSHIKPKVKAEGMLRWRGQHQEWEWPNCFYIPTFSDPPPLFPAASSLHNNRFPITAPSFTPSLNHIWTIFIPASELIWKEKPQRVLVYMVTHTCSCIFVHVCKACAMEAYVCVYEYASCVCVVWSV